MQDNLEKVLTALNDIGPIELPHRFEIDVKDLVAINHGFTLEAINKSEDEEMEKLEPDGHDEEMSSTVSYVGMFYEDLRRAANNFAIVALVARLDHWIGRFRRRIPAEAKGPREKSALIGHLGALNEHLRDGGPVPINFFRELVTVRDSVVHHDAKKKWKDRSGETVRVAAEYVNDYGEVALEEEQVKEAIAKAIEQVKWYDERLEEHTAAP